MFIVINNTSEPSQSSELYYDLVFGLQRLLTEQFDLKIKLKDNYTDELAIAYAINRSKVDEQLKILEVLQQ